MKHGYQPKENTNPGYVPPHQGSKILSPFSGYCHDCAKWSKGEDGEFHCWAHGGVVERTPGGLLFCPSLEIDKDRPKVKPTPPKPSRRDGELLTIMLCEELRKRNVPDSDILDALNAAVERLLEGGEGV